jgi:hypothetical protein
MATTPYFQIGSLGELDIGQLGSTRRAAGTAWWSGRVLVGDPEVATVENALPQQGGGFRDHLGFTTQGITWDGRIKTTTRAILAAVESDLSLHRTGQSITNGVRSAPNTAYTKPGVLKDYWSEIQSVKAVLDRVGFGERSTLNSSGAFTITCRLQLFFRILA